MVCSHGYTTDLIKDKLELADMPAYTQPPRALIKNHQVDRNVAVTP